MRRLATLSCFILFGAGLLFAGGAHAQQQAPVISEIRVLGNKMTEAFLIRSSCSLAEGQRFQQEEVARAIRNLYKLGLFSDIQIFADTDVAEGIAIEIVVQEYPKLGAVIFSGNKAIKSSKLKKKLAFIPGQTLKPQDEKRARSEILDLYQEEGYLLAEVEAVREPPDEVGRVPVTFRIREGQKVNLKRIRFYGNEAFSDAKLRKPMEETKQDGWWFGGGKFNQEKYPEDQEKVLDFYRQNGYRDAEIVRDSLYYDETKKNLYIDITVKEGPLYTFGDISWEGNEQFPDAAIAEMVVAKAGDVYSSERVSKTIEQVSTSYGEIGYIGALVNRRETPGENHTIDVRFVVQENDPWKVRMIHISGNTKTKDRVIRRELWVQAGTTFRRGLIERSVRNLHQLNYFSDVQVLPRPQDETSEVDLTFKVEEKSTGTASVGAGYSETDGLVGTVGLQLPNFMGNGQQLDFQWEFGTQRKTFQIGFTEPWLMNTPTSLYGSLFWMTQQQYGGFDQRSRGAAVRVGRRLRWPDFSRVSVGYRIQKVDYVNFIDSLQVNESSLQGTITSSVSSGFTRDSRDLPTFATSGSVFSYTPTLAGGVLGGNTNFHKHEFMTSFYFPLFWKFALGLKSQLGMVVGYGGTTVPYSERYTPGGVSIYEGTMIRGYPEQSIGPRNASGTPLGGNSQLLLNLEITVPIVKDQFYGLLFADAGNAWASQPEISIFDLRRSVGFGIRIVAPMVGIMGFDFAWGVDRRQVDGAPVQMMTHFQFGPQFY